MKRTNVIIRGLTPANWQRGLELARVFDREFPDRVGKKNGVTYGYTGRRHYNVHRTAKGTIIVEPL